MRRSDSVPLMAILLLVCAAGCAHTALIRTVADPDTSVPPGASICVSADPEAKEWDFLPDMARKIERILTERGFKVATSSDAEYFLFFEFDRNTLLNRVRLEPLSGVSSGIRTMRTEGPFELTLSLRLIEAASYHEMGQSEFVWAGGAVLNDAPTESPRFVDMLLVAGLKYFPDDTGRVVRSRVGLYDPRVKRLRH